MTALHASISTPASPQIVDDPRARFRDLLASEWTKLWSLRSIRWALLTTVLAVLAISANAARSDLSNWPDYPPSTKADFVPLWSMGDAFPNNSSFILALATGSIGAIAIVGEYSSGMIRTTFAAVPARRAVLAAKVVVLTALMLVAGLVMAFGSFWISQAILSTQHIGISISQPHALRCILADAVFPVVCALVGLGLGALIRHSATTMVMVSVALLLLPTLLNSSLHQWVIDLHNATPIAAWQRLVFVLDADMLGDPGFHPTLTGSAVVFLLWPLVAVLLPLLIVRHRDH
ncbi:ABC transporter permease [Kitasatospora sp. NBC_01250]|uniref:ABC transporter permease subunit n=1 Tax=unclassified Kitasatospora TaxID=2633591 RepID=UPI002E0FEE5A|nr:MULTISPECIES: ABC transporter permease subunit [unclassified Kitasatospora]WSJ66835.1 ABC transporter permease [Kitasatospora sp. NBC_01302]